jgi:hypothetical protein
MICQVTRREKILGFGHQALLLKSSKTRPLNTRVNTSNTQLKPQGDAHNKPQQHRPRIKEGSHKGPETMHYALTMYGNARAYKQQNMISFPLHMG